MAEPTPGQICYEAYCQAHGDPAWFSPWQELLRYRQAPWEAAAQAVQDAVLQDLLAGGAQAREEREVRRVQG